MDCGVGKCHLKLFHKSFIQQLLVVVGILKKNSINLKSDFQRILIDLF